MNVTVEIEHRGPGPAPRDWVCRSCHAPSDLAVVREHLFVCPLCGYHARIGARERIGQLCDPDSFRELWDGVKTLDPLRFVDIQTYPERVLEAQGKTGLTEAIVTGTATIGGTACVLAVLDFGFMAGSMGSVVGEKLWRSAELAAGEHLPLVAVCSSGGARMQEGILSLMQMAKTSCAVDLMAEAGVQFIALLVDPCTGGVVASFATLADICVAEPGAQLYFSGPRVIQQTTREALPAGFGSAERNLELGHLDAIVRREDLNEKLGAYLRLLKGGEGPERGETRGSGGQGTGRLAEATRERAQAVAAYARRAFVRGDRQAPDEAEDPSA